MGPGCANHALQEVGDLVHHQGKDGGEARQDDSNADTQPHLLLYVLHSEESDRNFPDDEASPHGEKWDTRVFDRMVRRVPEAYILIG